MRSIALTLTIVILALSSSTLAQATPIENKGWGPREISNAARDLIEKTRERYSNIIEEMKVVRFVVETRAKEINAQLEQSPS